MLVLMMATTLGSDRDSKGAAMPVVSYVAGKTYQLGNELATAFISMGVAKKEVLEPMHASQGKDQGTSEPVATTQSRKGKPVAKKEKLKRKDAGAAPENKSH